MSTVFDVDSISVEQNDATVLTSGIEQITVSVAVDDIETVTIVEPSAVQTVSVEVPGIQGPPGLQNVYVQENDPAVEFGWGLEETNYIWIKT